MDDEADLEERMLRLGAGIAQLGLARDGTEVTVWPRDERTGLYQVTVQERGKALAVVAVYTAIADALRAGVAEVRQRGGHA